MSEIITTLGSLDQTVDLKTGEQLVIQIVNLPRPNISYDVQYNTSLTVNLNGPGANVKVYSIGVIDSRTKLDQVITVNHNSSDCQSEVICKNVLLEAGAKAKWLGNVVINSGAVGTQTYEENRNLVLERGAKVSSEPNLEIFEGDIIGAGHASATGRFDEEQLFYLMSRGISETDAKRLVVNGFVNSVLEKMILTNEETEQIGQKLNGIIGGEIDE
jgi:Fe-S cluster assembly protein SufD